MLHIVCVLSVVSEPPPFVVIRPRNDGGFSVPGGQKLVLQRMPSILAPFKHILLRAEIGSDCSRWKAGAFDDLPAS